MSDNKKTYERALGDWFDLHKSGSLSVPANIGATAIFCTYTELMRGSGVGAGSVYRGRDIKLFRREALSIADRMRADGGNPEVILDTRYSDIVDVLTDPTFSSIIFIGHGCLSSVYVPTYDKQIGVCDWEYVSKAADHLKTGTFFQRVCGNFGREFNVPLGTFAVTDHRNVVAPVGLQFKPKGLEHPHNDFLEPVTTDRVMTYKYIRESFPAAS
jgi:hypothetical protein